MAESTGATILELMRHQIEMAWGENRIERVISRYATVEGARVSSALTSINALAMAIGADPEIVERAVRQLCSDALVMRIGQASHPMYVLTPLGYVHSVCPSSSDARNLELALSQITESLRSKWTTSAGLSNDVVRIVSPQHASFILFLLVGGAIGESRPFCWDTNDPSRASVARELLLDLTATLDSPKAQRRWDRNEELANFIRRPIAQHSRQVGPILKKVEGRGSESYVYLDIAHTPAAMITILKEISRTLGCAAVEVTVEHLEQLPWGRNPKFQREIAAIRALFGGRHPTPLDERRMLTRAAADACVALASETSVE